MADDTDLTLPLTPAKLGRAVGTIIDRAFPPPRQEDCMRVGEMERALTALCGEAVQLAYNDANREYDKLRADNDRLTRELAEIREHMAMDRQAVITLREREQQAREEVRRG